MVGQQIFIIQTLKMKDVLIKTKICSLQVYGVGARLGLYYF